ncbi:cysteine-rich CWC family protein [Bradyrhizobium sp. HKCCYLS2038]|uniref:cysteine-rich CWC family protein n=1 Tax=unclassified Bradyrhizobium TaxID=2631580 RepID=UPI003EB82465
MVPKVTKRLANVTARQLVCESCGTSFSCDPGGSCWCFAEQARLPLPKAGQSGFKDCLCVNCLTRLAAEAEPTR